MKIKTVCLSVSILLFFLSSSFLEAGEYISYGAGTHSCGRWLAARKSNDYVIYGQWMLGFTSAVGYYDVYDLKDTDAQAMMAWVDNYCSANPLDDFSIAVQKLIKELRIE